MASSRENYPDDWSDVEINLWEDVTEFTPATRDPLAMELYHETYFTDWMFDSGRLNELGEDMWDARAQLADYLFIGYGIEWDREFDWEDYRDWYDSL